MAGDRIFENKGNAVNIYPASTTDDYHEAKALMLEYRDVALGEDYAIGGAGLNEELEQFPGPYASPTGTILLARCDDVVCGCVALRQIRGEVGEVMRMYVKEVFRGQGIAEKLLRQLLVLAQSANYKRLCLDSLKRFTAAHKLYEKLGFQYCDFYDPHTTESMKQHMVFMQLDLSPSTSPCDLIAG